MLIWSRFRMASARQSAIFLRFFPHNLLSLLLKFVKFVSTVSWRGSTTARAQLSSQRLKGGFCTLMMRCIVLSLIAQMHLLLKVLHYLLDYRITLLSNFWSSFLGGCSFIVISGLWHYRYYLLFFYLTGCGAVILCCGLCYDFDLLFFLSAIIFR